MMALPPPGERKPRPPKGKAKSRRYALTFCNYTKDSTDENNWHVAEVKSTSVQSALTALVKVAREMFNKPELRKTDLVLIEAALIPPRVTLDEFMGFTAELDDE